MGVALPIIIDCDPGQDDALMLFMALASPEFDIRGIVAVAGNVPLAKTALNLRILVDIAGRGDVPLYAGCARPMVRNLVTAEYVHGPSGIDGVEIYEPELALQAQHGVDFIIETLRAADDSEITLVPTGPLTNIAMAITKAPDILPKIKQIVLMGGAMFEGGNVTPSAEFNIYVDPHACDVVLKCGRPIVAFGLDVTHKVMSTHRWVGQVRAIDNHVAQVTADFMAHFDRFDAEKYGTEGAPLHDPCTIAWLLKPELFKLKSCACAVETGSELTMGHTAVDFWGTTDNPKNIDWAYDVDVEGFFDLLTELLGRYS